MLTGVAFGLVPALRATRVDLAGAMKESSRSVTGSRTLLSKGLLVLQVAMSLVLLIGAGVGSAPLVALAEELAPGADVVVLHRASGPGPFGRDLHRLAERGVRVLHLPGRRRAPASWLGDAHAGPFSDLTALRHWVPDIAHRDVYVCGPTPWADLVVADLRRAGVPESHVHVEAFGW